MKINHSILILFGLVFLGAIAQPENSAATPPTQGVAGQSLDPSTGGRHLPRDHFHSVQKTTQAPFSPPANSATPDVKTIGTNLKAFGVPFNINANDESFIEVQLYLSRDRGSTWDFYARQNTDRNDFPFRADGDGEYWFALKTLNRDRRLIPDGDPQAELKIVVDTVKPELDFRVETDAAGRVACRWNATDKNLEPQSLRMMYQPIDSSGAVGQWQPVPVNLNGKSRAGVYADQVAWWPETSERQLNVAIEIRDLGGNVAQENRQVMIPPTAWRHRPESMAQITDTNRAPAEVPSQLAGKQPADLPGPPLPEAAKTPAQTAGHPTHPTNSNHPDNVVCEDGVCRIVPAKLIGSEVEQVAPPVPEGYVPPEPRSAEPSQPGTARNSGSIVWRSEPQKRLSQNRSTVGTTVGFSPGPDPAMAPAINPRQSIANSVTDIPSNPAFRTESGDQVINESSTMGATNQYRGLHSQGDRAIASPTLLPGQTNQQHNLVANQHPYPNTGHAGFEAIASSDRSGSHSNFINASHPEQTTRQPETRGPTTHRDSSAAERVIGTRRFRLDYGIDAIDPSGVARVDLWMTPDGRSWHAWGSDPDNQSPFPVEVERDGRYGFRIVVHSKDGLTGQGPAAGDPADLWVLVDSQSPLVHITSVPYGRGNEAGRLVINYSASDDQIALRPITLAYSASPQGPWKLIGEGIRNEGRHLWKPTTDVPDQIYLRIEALDKAGNVGVHVLSQVIDVSGLVPQGTIRGVSPVGR